MSAVRREAFEILSNSKRNAKLAEQIAAIEAGETLEMLICKACGRKPSRDFGIDPKTTKPYSNCKPCHVKMLERTAEYKKTEEGKAANKRYKKTDTRKESNKRYKKNEEGKATNKR